MNTRATLTYVAGTNLAHGQIAHDATRGAKHERIAPACVYDRSLATDAVANDLDRLGDGDAFLVDADWHDDAFVFLRIADGLATTNERVSEGASVRIPRLAVR